MASESTSTRHPFAAELIARAAKIGAKLRAQQDQSDSSGCYSDEIHRELLEGGFYRVLQPRMFKGGGVDCETYIRVILGCRPTSAMCRCTASTFSRRRSHRCCGRSCSSVPKCRCRFARVPRRRRHVELSRRSARLVRC